MSQIKCPVVVYHNEMQKKSLRFNLNMILCRANDALHSYDTDEIETIKAELSYLRMYLNDADKIISSLIPRKEG